jgi:protein O-GlcNAc transferase
MHARSPNTVETARALIERGSFVEAVRVCEQVLARASQDLNARFFHGIALAQLGRDREAIASLRRAVAIDPRPAVLHYALGNSMLASGDLAEAAAAYREALVRDPAFGDAANGLGVALKRQGRAAEAADSFRHAIRLKPGSAEAHSNLGSALLDAGDIAAALSSFEASLALRPADAATLHELAAASITFARDALGRGDPAAAAKIFQRALTHQGLPEQYDVWLALAEACEQLGRTAEATLALESAVRLRPDSAVAHYALGSALHKQGRLPAAMASYERVIELDPSHRESHTQRGFVLEAQGRPAEAVACFREALARGADDVHALAGLVSCGVRLCDFELVREHLARLRALPGGIETMHPFVLLAISNDPAEQLRASRALASNAAQRCARLAPAQTYPQHERIRVAYLSPDFREHAVAILIAALLEKHDRRRFEVIGIALNPPDDTATGKRIRAACDQLHTVWQKSDAEVSQLLRELEVDIAVDLAGFTNGNRAAILACRPAPVQVSYLGFPGTLGAEYIDYIIADSVLVSSDDHSAYTERVVCLPDSYQVNDSRYDIAERTPSRAELGLPENGFVFCCFNNSFKITEALFAVWMRLLTDVPGSVLWLADTRAEVADNLRRVASALGVEPARLIFAPRVPDRADHLARYRCADLFLDTLPFNAHATATDALWAGLPVLTVKGATFAGRVAASLLGTMELEKDLVCSDLATYEVRARELATAPERLALLREKLARRRESSPLFDTDRFCRHIEAAYVTMWERACKGEPPASFSVADIS